MDVFVVLILVANWAFVPTLSFVALYPRGSYDLRKWMPLVADADASTLASCTEA